MPRGESGQKYETFSSSPSPFVPQRQHGETFSSSPSRFRDHPAQPTTTSCIRYMLLLQPWCPSGLILRRARLLFSLFPKRTPPRPPTLLSPTLFLLAPRWNCSRGQKNFWLFFCGKEEGEGRAFCSAAAEEEEEAWQKCIKGPREKKRRGKRRSGEDDDEDDDARNSLRRRKKSPFLFLSFSFFVGAPSSSVPAIYYFSFPPSFSSCSVHAQKRENKRWERVSGKKGSEKKDAIIHFSSPSLALAHTQPLARGPPRLKWKEQKKEEGKLDSPSLSFFPPTPQGVSPRESDRRTRDQWPRSVSSNPAPSSSARQGRDKRNGHLPSQESPPPPPPWDKLPRRCRRLPSSSSSSHPPSPSVSQEFFSFSFFFLPHKRPPRFRQKKLFGFYPPPSLYGPEGGLSKLSLSLFLRRRKSRSQKYFPPPASDIREIEGGKGKERRGLEDAFTKK